MKKNIFNKKLYEFSFTEIVLFGIISSVLISIITLFFGYTMDTSIILSYILFCTVFILYNMQRYIENRFK